MSAAIALSNRFAMVEREQVGVVQGVDFGYSFYCLARAPTVALMWDGGSSYTSGRQTCYGESQLTILFKLGPHWGQHPEYRRLGQSGGRLSVARVGAVAAEIEAAFDDESVMLPLLEAVRLRKTLVIEGGWDGFTLIPPRFKGGKK
jgi:hypothetical protein